MTVKMTFKRHYWVSLKTFFSHEIVPLVEKQNKKTTTPYFDIAHQDIKLLRAFLEALLFVAFQGKYKLQTFIHKKDHRMYLV